MHDKNRIHETELFTEWLAKLRDMKGKGRNKAPIYSASSGNFGDCKALEDGVCEMRIDVGPGDRIYYAQEGLNVYLLLIGGDKSSQKKDLSKAKELWRIIKEERQ